MEKQAMITCTSTNEINWNRLPTELWLHIFGYLPHSTILFIIRQVCHRFRSLSFDPYLWTHIDCNEWKEFTTTSFLPIKDTTFHSEDNNILEGLTRKLCKEDHLSSTDLFSPVLSHVAESVHSLKFNGYSDGFVLGTKQLVSMLKCCNLTYLDFGFCKKVTNSVLDKICQGCPKINTLILRGCSEITNEGMESLSKLSDLIKLDISHCSQINDSGINYISQMPYQILHFLADGVQHVTDSAIVDLVSNQTKIETLVLDGESLSDVSIVKICYNLLNLKTFQMSVCNGLTDRSCDSLCGKISRLEHLRLNQLSSQITTSGIRQMFQQEQPMQLRRLVIADCQAMTDETIEAISVKCPLLEEIALRDCCEVTDAGVSKLIQNCRNLRRLTLHRLEQLIGAWLQDVDKYLPYLVFLDLRLCDRISYDDLYRLVQRLPNLSAYGYNCEKVDHLTVLKSAQETHVELNLKNYYTSLEECSGPEGRSVDF